MRHARLVVLFVIAAALPAPAHADGWWAWLEELSGPGYFQGPMYTMPVACWLGPQSVPCEPFKAHPGVERNKRVDRSLQLTVGWLTSNDRPRFKDLPAVPPNTDHVVVVPLNVALMFRPHRSIDIGPGAGVLLFSGPNVNDHARFVLLPVAASWKFLLTKNTARNTRLRRLFSIDFQTYYITKGFNGHSFGSSTTTFKSPPELKGAVGLSIDLEEWR